MSTFIDQEVSQLVVVDMQERLAPAIQHIDSITANIGLLLAAAARLGVPVTVTEQYRKGLGETIAAVREALPQSATVVQKTAFSALAEPEIAAHMTGLTGAGRDAVIICGVEAHVCVLQTAFGALGIGARVIIIADAIGSRSAINHAVALQRARDAGIEVVTTEMVVFEWLKRAATEDFRALQPMIKRTPLPG